MTEKVKRALSKDGYMKIHWSHYLYLMATTGAFWGLQIAEFFK